MKPSPNQFLHLCLCLVLLFSCNGNKSSFVRINQADGPNPWTNLDWNNKSENFQFVVVTDRTGGNRLGVFEQGVEKVNLLQPEFVMSVGDLIQGYTQDREAVIQEWDEFDTFVDGLEMPFFYVPGNHDITNRVMEDLWAERYGRTYYHFVYQDVLFLCLNSEEMTPDQEDPNARYNTGDFYLSQNQRNYIKNTLQEHQNVRWTFVFWHKPVWLYEDSEDPQRNESVQESGWPEVCNWLKDRKHTVFAGHIHRYDYKERNNNDYITLATTGGGSALRGPIFGQFDHVLWVTMTDDGPIMANLMLNGIFDKDFQKEDIQKNLELSMRHMVMRPDTEMNQDKNPESQTLNFTLFNSLDLPANVTVNFTNTEEITFSDIQPTLSIPPNSAVPLSVELTPKPALAVVSEDQDSSQEPDIWESIKGAQAHWALTYELEQYGIIEVKGSSRLFK